MSMIDLHVHTSASDGFYEPGEVIKKARESGLKAIAITDHDTTDGVEEAYQKSQETGLLLIPGVELSTEFDEKEIHILGYLMNYQEEGFQKELLVFRNERLERAKKMVEKLNILGYNITFENVKEFSKGAALGRPHIAEALIAKGYLKSIKEAFTTLLGRGKPAYVPRNKLTPQGAVQLIRRYKGIPIIAHPGLAQRDYIIPELLQDGLMGIEVYHPDHKLRDIIKYQTIAESHKLLITAGSDFHGTGSNAKCLLGVPGVDMSIVESLLKAKESLENASC